MRTLILAGLGTLLVTAAWAGTGTCIYDDAAGKALADALKVQPAQLCQTVLDRQLKQAALADRARKLHQLQTACQNKNDKAACAALDTATKQAPK